MFERMHIEPGMHPRIVDKVLAMKDEIRKQIGVQKNEFGIPASVDKITQKVAIHLTEGQSVFIIQSSDLKFFIGYDLEQNKTGILLSGKFLYYPQCFY